MKKLNKKGFTLIELLAVIVILAILVTVSIPSITKYMDSSKKKKFAINVSRAIEAIRTDISSGAVSSTKKYTLSEINALLDNKLNKSSYGNNYDSSSYIEVTIVDDRPTYEICIIDSKGNGIYKENSVDRSKITNGITSKCGVLKVEYAKSYGGSSYDYGRSVASTSDGGYVVTGEYDSSTMTIPANATANNIAITLTNAGNSDIFIIKYNSTGKVEYAKSYGGSSYDYGRSVAPTSDGGYIVVGEYTSSTMTIPASDTINNTTITLTTSSYNIFIIKYNSNNKVEYAKSYGGSGSDYG